MEETAKGVQKISRLIGTYYIVIVKPSDISLILFNNKAFPCIPFNSFMHSNDSEFCTK